MSHKSKFLMRTMPEKRKVRRKIDSRLSEKGMTPASAQSLYTPPLPEWHLRSLSAAETTSPCKHPLFSHRVCAYIIPKIATPLFSLNVDIGRTDRVCAGRGNPHVLKRESWGISTASLRYPPT